EAGQRCDRLAALDESGQREAEREQLRIVRADAAHREESDLHETPPISVHTTANTNATTGMKNRWRNPSRHAVRKHTAGMAMPPTMKPIDAPVAVASPATGHGDIA